MKIYFETYGCTANKADELTMRTLLKEKFDFIENIEKSDIIIILTCGVKGSTQNKIFHKLETIKNDFPSKRVIVAGCLPKIITKKFEKYFPDFSLIGPYQINDILDITEKILNGKKVIDLKFKKNECTISKIVNKKHPIVIASGCLNKCAYCATKIAKGNLNSFPIKKIIKNVEHSIENGAEKIFLTATDTSAYGKDIGTDLIELLKKIIKIKKDFKIRIGMMNPDNVLNFLDELIEIYKDSRIIKFIHIPIQSGSDKVLKEMRRNYKVNDFKKIIKKFRRHIPDIIISTDIICGFPTETKKDFEKTLNLIKEVKPEVLNISKFYPRPGTEAKKMKQLSTKEIKERSKELSTLYEKLKKDLIKPNC